MKALSNRFRQPFWLVTLISGTLTSLTLAGLLAIYGRTSQWQYLALGAITAAILLAHAAAWALARDWGRANRGIWLIAAAQVLSAVLAPLFMADYWMIGPFLLAIVPLEVGVGDRLRRMPVFVMLGLLGAAGMLAVDLLAQTPRLTVLADLPLAAALSVTVLTLHLAGLAFLLWRL
ncbi:MAG TPA: hypothetical protein VF915_10550, partial [Reyranella sp.]